MYKPRKKVYATRLFGMISRLYEKHTFMLSLKAINSTLQTYHPNFYIMFILI
jgi:hypothetical protein